MGNLQEELSKRILNWMATLDHKDWPRVQSNEVSLLIHYATQLEPGAILVEVGTGWGGTAAIFAKVCRPTVDIYTIDDGSNFKRFGPGKGISYDDFMVGRFRLYEVGGRVNWILADSKTMNWDRPVDLLFIDGNHSYEGVKGDIENWVPHVVDDAVVLFHDYHMKGVKKAVDEFLEQNEYEIERRAHCTRAVRIKRG